jgi:hypothetical protein
MKKVFYQRDKVELYLDAQPFASGGEGNLHRVRRPAKYVNFAVKIYHQDKRTAAREQKVKYMISNPPIDYVPNGFFPVVWPLGTIYERSGFAGFLMPLAKGEKLQVLSVPRLPKKYMKKWGRFDFSTPNAINLRLKICFNIATAVRQLHETNHYVLVDLKTDNIIIKENGFISIVDMDSVQVIDNGKVLFPATVTTPEYTPSEYYSRNVQPKKVPIPETWDLFSMTIIFYKLLFGIHPFAASAKAPYEKMTSLHQKIEAGLFVHSISKSSAFQVIPPPHRKFSTLNPVIQGLFLQCFEDGHENPDARPDADEWCWAITPSSQYLVDRKLPSKEAEIGKITYTKPLNAATTGSKMLPRVVPKNLPVVATADFSGVDYKIPRGIAGTAIAAFVIWMVTFGFSFAISSFMQFLVFAGSSTGMLYAYFRELPATKQKRLSGKRLSHLRNERSQNGRELDKIKRQIAALPDKQKQISKNFEKQQQQNLINEKKLIESHIRELRRYMSEQDKAARELLKAEAAEIQTLQKSLFGTVYDDFKRLSRMTIEEQIEYLEKEKANTEKRLEQRYRQQIASISTDAEKKKSLETERLQNKYQGEIRSFELEIKSLKIKRKQEETALRKHNQIRNSEALRQYNIREYSGEIFTIPQPLSNVICDYLERSDVRTAADFMDVSADGRVKKPISQRYEKIPFMTKERGAELMIWRQKLESELNKTDVISNEKIAELDKKYNPARIQATIAQLKTELAQKLEVLNQVSDGSSERNRLIVAFRKEVTTTNEKLEKAIIALRANKVVYQNKKTIIEEKYDEQHVVFEEKVRSFGSKILSQIEAINDKTLGENQQLLDKTMELTKKYTSEKAMTAMISVNDRMKVLNDLDQEFHEVKAEKEAFKDITFERFLREVAFLK